MPLGVSQARFVVPAKERVAEATANQHPSPDTDMEDSDDSDAYTDTDTDTDTESATSTMTTMSTTEVQANAPKIQSDAPKAGSSTAQVQPRASETQSNPPRVQSNAPKICSSVPKAQSSASVQAPKPATAPAPATGNQLPSPDTVMEDSDDISSDEDEDECVTDKESATARQDIVGTIEWADQAEKEHPGFKDDLLRTFMDSHSVAYLQGEHTKNIKRSKERLRVEWRGMPPVPEESENPFQESIETMQKHFTNVWAYAKAHNTFSIPLGTTAGVQCWVKELAESHLEIVSKMTQNANFLLSTIKEREKERDETLERAAGHPGATGKSNTLSLQEDVRMAEDDSVPKADHTALQKQLVALRAEKEEEAKRLIRYRKERDDARATLEKETACRLRLEADNQTLKLEVSRRPNPPYASRQAKLEAARRRRDERMANRARLANSHQTAN
ncbi:MAG: hypothetical protein Q9227_004065 [Pyrenula ochraceoflavens]